MRFRRPLVCAAALALLGAGPPDAFELRTLAGEPVRVAHGPGEPDVVLHFWATWCRECEAELPSLALAAKSCDPARVRVWAVNVAEKPELVKAYLAEHPLALPVLLDPGGRGWRAAGFFGLPANLIWTKRGATTSFGPTSPQRWREQLAGLGCQADAPGAAPPASE